MPSVIIFLLQALFFAPYQQRNRPLLSPSGLHLLGSSNELPSHTFWTRAKNSQTCENKAERDDLGDQRHAHSISYACRILGLSPGGPGGEVEVHQLLCGSKVLGATRCHDLALDEDKDPIGHS